MRKLGMVLTLTLFALLLAPGCTARETPGPGDEFLDPDAAFETARWFARRHGLFCGVSAGANLWAAMEIAKEAPGDRVIVTVAPDRGDKYLSTGAFDE